MVTLFIVANATAMHVRSLFTV